MVFFTLAALGASAKGVFDYNRENYGFDKKQQLEQQVLRLEMQLKRFGLFRQDIRDLVKLTIDRMDVYHLVGALFLQFCIVILTKGRVQASAPPFLLSLFLMTNASAFVYLLLAVWMSMHASIASHSFGVRLLTRFVRLPIPSVQQLRELTFKYKDFEQQGVANLLQMPFAGRRKLAGEEEDAPADEPADSQDQKESLGDVSTYLSRTDSSGLPKRPDLVEATVPVLMSASKERELVASTLPASYAEGEGMNELLPDLDSSPLPGDGLLSGSSGALPERHVQLFRQLQAKWQCYDAYCRVCMGLGMNQMLQVLSYYGICHTIVENNSPTTGFAMVALFQCTTVAVGMLDLAGFKSREIIVVQIIGMFPCFLTAGSMSRGTRDRHGVLDPDENYTLSPLSFLFTVLWLELWLRVASPSSDRARLPRRFRQVLFLDVFGDTPGLDTSELPEDALSMDALDTEGDDSGQLAQVSQQARRRQLLATHGLQRWRQVPGWALSMGQRRDLQALQEQLRRVSGALQAELEKHHTVSDLPEQANPFAKCLLGPFSHDGAACYYYDVDAQQTLFADDSSRLRPGEPVLEMGALAAIMQDLEDEVRRLLELRIVRELRAETRRQRDHRRARRRSNLLKVHTSTAMASFPNLASLVHSWRNSTSSGGAYSVAQSAAEPLEPQQSNGSGTEHPASTAAVAGAAAGQQPDQTLVAVAGENARHFVPERLPWLLVRGMTRVLQLCWAWACFMALLREIHLYTIDFGVQVIKQQKEPGQAKEALTRSLSAAQGWSSELIEVNWPHGSFFRPHGLHCPAVEEDLMFLSSAFGLHSASLGSARPLQLREVQRGRLPAVGTVLCGPWLSEFAGGPTGGLTSPCLTVSISGSTATLAPLGKAANSTVLQLEGAPWRAVAATGVPCKRAARLLPPGVGDAGWCLLLAGWDGATLPVAATRLPLQLSLPTLAAGVSAPLSLPQGSDVASLHLDQGGRLLALLSNGYVEAWDLPNLRRLGRWRLGMPRTAKPVALCEDLQGRLVLLAQTDAEGPTLAWARAPAWA